jgi:hypothetical protein
MAQWVVLRSPAAAARRAALLTLTLLPGNLVAIFLSASNLRQDDAWVALEHVAWGDFDLALCALRLGEMTGVRTYRLIARKRPYMAARIVFMTEADALLAAPPSSALGRVLPRPISTAAVRGSPRGAGVARTMAI